MKDIELFNDHFQNFKAYGIPKAQLIIADVPYNLGANAYASNPAWYVDGDNKNGESALAGKQFFDTDKDFRPAEFMHFCSQMLRKDKPIKEEKSEGGGRSKGGAACMILFCPFEQMHYYIELGQRYGLKRYIPLVFRKDFSAQVLKANMKVVGNCEYGLILYRDRLPKFNNDGSKGITKNFKIAIRMKKILDACCGSRMCWFDKDNPDTVFMDCRSEEHTLCDGRRLEIRPDVVGDFRKMPFPDNSFYLVLFDPPHLNNLGESSWLAKKYGRLLPSWEDDIRQGFEECMRVLKPNGTLIFKWNEQQIPTARIIEIIGQKPLFGHTSGKGGKTIWMCFLKNEKSNETHL